MTAASPAIARKANFGGAEICGRSRNTLRSDDTVISVCRAIFPNKCAQHVSDLTGYPLRTVEYIFAGGKMPADMLATLIRSDYGVRFVSALMVDATPTWWTRIKSYLTTLDAMKLQRAAQRKLQEALDAESDLSAAIENSTRIFSGEDVVRDHRNARGVVAHKQNRALAAK